MGANTAGGEVCECGVDLIPCFRVSKLADEKVVLARQPSFSVETLIKFI